MIFKSVLKSKSIEFLSLSPEQCADMVRAYFIDGGNENFSDRAFDLFIEYHQADIRVEFFRIACEEALANYALSNSAERDYWKTAEGIVFLKKLLGEL